MNNNTIREEDKRVLQVPVEDIIPNRFQPRLSFDPKALEELSSSIKQHGIIQPLVLRRIGDKYEIIAGERRYKAATLAGLTSVPAIISDLDDNESAEVAIVENIQRKDLTAIEEAKSFKALLDKGYMTQEDLAKKMGLSQAAISNKLRLLSLDNEVQQAVLDEKISERHARSLLKFKDPKDQVAMLNRIIQERLTVRQVEEEIRKMNENIEVPTIETPDLNSIVNNAMDIIPNIPEKEEPKEDVETTPMDPGAMFGSPEKMQNKFFNFLEDEAANMSIEEPPMVFEQPTPVEEPASVQETPVVEEEIEMLDDLTPPIIPVETPVEKNMTVNEVINKIRDLNLPSDLVKIEEINLPNEYHINIVINKE